MDLGLAACPCTQGTAVIVVYCEELKILCQTSCERSQNHKVFLVGVDPHGSLSPTL